MNTAKSAEIWAPALSEDGQYLAGVSQDGHIKVWDLNAEGEQIQDYETKGSFGTCLDMVGYCYMCLHWLRHSRIDIVSRWPFHSQWV